MFGLMIVCAVVFIVIIIFFFNFRLYLFDNALMTKFEWEIHTSMW